MKTFSFNTEYKITDITDENKYGITMQESGVSKLVSVKLEDHDEVL